ncbi:hypothetical protein HOY82DRAFT_630348 [Tuber indicum]|nr:hypothetical protein HOY82DRAFT_630348 [Tuber indicum]
MAKNLQKRIDRIKTLKKSLSSELQLREARTSTQLAHTVNLFAVVTAIYLPLTFSTSIVAIQGLNWSSPAKSLIRIALAVTFGTLILLMNLAFLRRSFAALKIWAQRSIRERMAGAPEPRSPCENPVYKKKWKYWQERARSLHEAGKLSTLLKTSTGERAAGTPEPKSSRKKPVHQEKQPTWKYWEERAHSLHEAEKRSMLLTDNNIHGNESDWWYWYFLAIFVIVVVPVRELTFIIRTVRLQKIENAGPLKKLVRLPGALIWVPQLALVYLIILAGYAILSLVGLVHLTAVWLWTGHGITEGKNAAPESEGSLMPEPNSAKKDRGLVGWLLKPAETMGLYMVAEALGFQEKEKKPDVENKVAPTENTEAYPST